MKYTIGIDEVGRGALAGPVSVGAFLVFSNKESIIKKSAKKQGFKFADSKKLRKDQREAWLSFLQEMVGKKYCAFSVVHQSSNIVDTKGLTKAINQALAKSLQNLKADAKVSKILLDGGLHAPVVFKNQKTIIKGDEKEFSIMCASIVAKVTRDTLMKKMAKKHPSYGFEKHVGYGTKEHVKNIRTHGHSPIHRRTFLSRI